MMSKMPRGCRYPTCACTYPDCQELPHQLYERRETEIREAMNMEYRRHDMLNRLAEASSKKN